MGWMVIHRDNFTSDYQIFFCLLLKKLLAYFLSSTVCMFQSIGYTLKPCLQGNVCIISCAFYRGAGGYERNFWKFWRGGGNYPSELGVLSEICSMVGVWIFSGTTHTRPCSADFATLY